MEPLVFNLEALQSLQRFGDILEASIRAVQSEQIELEPVRMAKDGVGPHWYGMRCNMQCKETGNQYYLHLGLIFHPGTRTGMMVELDQKSNPCLYGTVTEKIQAGSDFEINTEEADYLKLFMPPAVFEQIYEMEAGAQKEYLTGFLQSSAEALAKAGKEKGFQLSHRDLEEARRLGEAFRDVVRNTDSSECSIEINESDRDNFGDYAQGYRYFLTDVETGAEFYAYFGAIYSYKKRPFGIFAEIDEYSNPTVFTPAFTNIKESEQYDISRQESKFLKLFLKLDLTEAFKLAGYERQIEILEDFLRESSEQIVKAYRRETENGK